MTARGRAPTPPKQVSGTSKYVYAPIGGVFTTDFPGDGPEQFAWPTGHIDKVGDLFINTTTEKAWAYSPDPRTPGTFVWARLGADELVFLGPLDLGGPDGDPNTTGAVGKEQGDHLVTDSAVWFWNIDNPVIEAFYGLKAGGETVTQQIPAVAAQANLPTTRPDGSALQPGDVTVTKDTNAGWIYKVDGGAPIAWVDSGETYDGTPKWVREFNIGSKGHKFDHRDFVKPEPGVRADAALLRANGVRPNDVFVDGGNRRQLNTLGIARSAATGNHGDEIGILATDLDNIIQGSPVLEIEVDIDPGTVAARGTWGLQMGDIGNVGVGSSNPAEGTLVVVGKNTAGTRAQTIMAATMVHVAGNGPDLTPCIIDSGILDAAGRVTPNPRPQLGFTGAAQFKQAPHRFVNMKLRVEKEALPNHGLKTTFTVSDGVTTTISEVTKTNDPNDGWSTAVFGVWVALAGVVGDITVRAIDTTGAVLGIQTWNPLDYLTQLTGSADTTLSIAGSNWRVFGRGIVGAVDSAPAPPAAAVATQRWSANDVWLSPQPPDAATAAENDVWIGPDGVSRMVAGVWVEQVGFDVLDFYTPSDMAKLATAKPGDRIVLTATGQAGTLFARGDAPAGSVVVPAGPYDLQLEFHVGPVASNAGGAGFLHVDAANRVTYSEPFPPPGQIGGTTLVSPDVKKVLTPDSLGRMIWMAPDEIAEKAEWYNPADGWHTPRVTLYGLLDTPMWDFIRDQIGLAAGESVVVINPHADVAAGESRYSVVREADVAGRTPHVGTLARLGGGSEPATKMTGQPLTLYDIWARPLFTRIREPDRVSAIRSVDEHKILMTDVAGGPVWVDPMFVDETRAHVYDANKAGGAGWTRAKYRTIIGDIAGDGGAAILAGIMSGTLSLVAGEWLVAHDPHPRVPGSEWIGIDFAAVTAMRGGANLSGIQLHNMQLAVAAPTTRADSSPLVDHDLWVESVVPTGQAGGAARPVIRQFYGAGAMAAPYTLAANWGMPVGTIPDPTAAGNEPEAGDLYFDTNTGTVRELT